MNRPERVIKSSVAGVTSAGRIGVVVLAALLPLVARAQSAEAGAADLAALRGEAEKGDAQAQLEYAKALDGSARAQARAWARKSADQGLAEAWFWLGYTALQNENPASYYEQAAAKGYAAAFPYLLDDLLFRAGSSADVVKAKKFGDLARQLDVSIGFKSDKLLATINRCYEAGAPEIPAADRPSPDEIAAFDDDPTDCSEWTGRGTRPVDWARYRKCLLSDTEVDNNALAEIYANGWGVKRNPRLAIALVCHGSEVPFELVLMVETLVTTKNQAKLDEEFSFCAHATSGLNLGRCAAQEEGLAELKRGAALAALTASWSTAQKRALAALEKSAEAFFTEHASSELDRSGTASRVFMIDEEGTLRDDLLESITSFEQGALPVNADFTRADRELNLAYSKVMKAARGGSSTVTAHGIRATQRKWLSYRDAWARLGVARYPTVSAKQWKTWATAMRVVQLQDVLDEISD